MAISLPIKGLFFTALLLSSTLIPTGPLGAQSIQSPFVAVFVDDATEKAMGPFPYDRAKYAEALKLLKKDGAKAVVLKFFLDQVKPGPGDDRLAAEMKTLPVLLQARLDPKEPHPNPLPAGFDHPAEGDFRTLLSTESGWIPLEKFSQNCAGLGFVDIASSQRLLNVPMLVRYQGRLFPSLELAAMELAFGQKAKVRLADSITLAGHTLPVSPAGEITVQLPARDEMESISFISLLQGNFDPRRIKGKIVILGFDARETPTLPTTLGPLKIHRLFFYSLESLYQQLITH